MSTKQNNKTKPAVVLLYQCNAISTIEIEAGFATAETLVLPTPL